MSMGTGSIGAFAGGLAGGLQSGQMLDLDKRGLAIDEAQEARKQNTYTNRVAWSKAMAQQLAQRLRDAGVHDLANFVDWNDSGGSLNTIPLPQETLTQPDPDSPDTYGAAQPSAPQPTLEQIKANAMARAASPMAAGLRPRVPTGAPFDPESPNF